MTREQLLSIINDHKILPEKKFGQNFLCNDGLCRMIADEAMDGKRGAVIEIGPGIGSVTEYLASLSDHVTAVEIDKRLAEYLSNADSLSEIKLIVSDYLKLDPVSYGADRFISAVSNIPYYVTTPIMIKMITELSSCQRMVFMVEQAALDRIMATSGTKQYGPLAVLVSLFGDCEVITNVGPDSFYPAPHTVSSIIRMTRSDNTFPLDRSFAGFLDACFCQRRKTLINSLKTYTSARSLPPLKPILDKLDIREDIRAEDLSPRSLADIYLMWRS